MSTILMRRNVAISAHETGRELAQATHDVQAKFLIAMANAPNATWPDEGRRIVAEMNEQERWLVGRMLETLLDHLRESVQ